MVDKFSIAKYTFEGDRFEILVKPDPALDYKLGKLKDINSILVSDEIYSDAGKGTRASSEKLQKVFKTDEFSITSTVSIAKIGTPLRHILLSAFAYCKGKPFNLRVIFFSLAFSV